jgi:hypothetical protein
VGDVTPERLAEIRQTIDEPFHTVWRSDMRDLIAHIDAVTRERDEARALLSSAGVIGPDDWEEIAKDAGQMSNTLRRAQP